MGMIGGLDVHRAQITLDLLDPDTGESHRGEIRPATRERVGDWLAGLDVAAAEFALEATTGWRFIVEEIQRGRPCRTPGRTRRHARTSRRQTKGQRPCRCASPARTASNRPTAHLVDPAGAHRRTPGACAVAQGARRRAYVLAATHPCGPFPPRSAAKPQRVGPRAACVAREDRSA